MSSRSKFWRQHGYMTAVIIMSLATALFLLGRGTLSSGQWALLYLLLIGVVAILCGIRPALLAAVLAVVAWNFFFIPPIHTLNVTDRKDLLTLLIFTLVGVTMGVLAGYIREREAQALAREKEAMLLNRLTAHLVSFTSAEEMADTILRELAAYLQAPCLALLVPDGAESLRVLHVAPALTEVPERVLQLATRAIRFKLAIGLPAPRGADAAAWPVSRSHEQVAGGDARHDLYLPLQSSASIEGVLYVQERPDHKPYALGEVRVLIAMTHLAAAFFERLRLQEAATQRDVLREADRLKSTLISSVSHELKTPLTAVTAAVTSLLEDDVAWDLPTVRHELTAVHHDLERLHGSIGALLDFARLESAAWTPQRDWYELPEIIGQAASHFPHAVQQRIEVDIPDDFPLIHVDFQQWTRAFQHLLENAVAYSPAEAPIRIGAQQEGQEIEYWVQDLGSGVPPEERARIFEKFYRGSRASAVPGGAGLGLAITAEIVRFHDGRIWVEEGKPRGARFVIRVPYHAPEGEV